MSSSSSSEDEKQQQQHFVLVHGFCHGAWCWYKLVAVLKSAGHKATALDMGGCGVHPKKLAEISSMADYVEPLIAFMAELPADEKVVLVGHSYGGIPMSLAMERFSDKIRFAVFITAYMPNCVDPPSTLVQEFFVRSATKSFEDCEFDFDQTRKDLLMPVSALFGPKYMAKNVYDLCSHEDLELAKMLVRRNKFFLDELSDKTLLTYEKYGRIKRCYVICEDDKVMSEDFQRYIVEKSQPHDVFCIGRAGHMVMLSRTQQLCSYLQGICSKFEKIVIAKPP